jgi:hypothetical protein
MIRWGLVAVVVLTLVLPAPPAQAVILDVLSTYYTGSCENLSYNGYKWKECDGTITQSGTLSGTWRCDDTFECNDEDANIIYYWYERCNNTWVYRFTAGPGANRWPTSLDCGCT